MFEKGIFGGLFDLNGDGKMDLGERAMEFMFIEEIEKNSKKDNSESDSPFDIFGFGQERE